jgi:hypothetical protein
MESVAEFDTVFGMKDDTFQPSTGLILDVNIKLYGAAGIEWLLKGIKVAVVLVHVCEGTPT